MAVQKFLALVNGAVRQVKAVAQSSGATDAGKLLALGPDGRLDNSVMAAGVGQHVDIYPASEALSAGDFVNIFPDGGAAKVRKADNATGRKADGFVDEAVDQAANATVFPLDSVNAELTGLTPGTEYWLGTAGGVTSTPLDATDDGNTNKINQLLGVANSATELRTNDHTPTVL